MTNPTIKIHNTETDEIIEREMTAEEYQAHLIYLDKLTALEERQTRAEADKATAQAKLAALGLTADDLKALGL
jgi:hypothetical protein